MPEGTAPVTAPTAAPAPAPAAAPKLTADHRAAALADRLKAEESAPEPAAETSSDADVAPPAAAPSSSAVDSGVDARAKASAERLARINQVRKREAEARAKREKQEKARAGDKAATGEIEKLRARVAELEPLNKVFESEESLLAAAEAKNMSPEKLIAWMRTRLSDPQAVAQRQVKTEADALRAELEKVRKENEEWRAKQEEAQAQQRDQQEAHHRAVSFLNGVGARAESHPFVHAFMSKHGPQATIGYANRVVAPLLGEDYTLDELHDHFEQLLEETQLASGGSRTSESPANGASQANRNGAGQPVTTLSNSVAGERSTVSEAVPLHKMPLDKRAEYLKAKYARE